MCLSNAHLLLAVNQLLLRKYKLFNGNKTEGFSKEIQGPILIA